MAHFRGTRSSFGGVPSVAPATAEQAHRPSIRCDIFDESETKVTPARMNTTNPISSIPAQPSEASVPWLETQAEVIACRYEFARINTLSFGIATTPNFIVSFSYYAHAKTFFDEFAAPAAMGKGETFPVLYNPLNPQRNSLSEAASASRGPLFAFGIAGSIAISLIYLAMSGCY